MLHRSRRSSAGDNCGMARLQPMTKSMQWSFFKKYGSVQELRSTFGHLKKNLKKITQSFV